MLSCNENCAKNGNIGLSLLIKCNHDSNAAAAQLLLI